MKNIQTRVMMSAVLIMSAVLTSSAAPGSEAQFDRLVKAYVLNPDGSQELRVQKQLTIYTHAAMNNLYGETFIVYDPACQHLKINESYTRQVDGTIIETPANAFVEVLPSAAANAPAYNGLREMVVVHTGLELGATIYLDYTLTTDAGALPALDIFEQVEELSPIKYYELSVSVPSGTPLHYSLLNGRTSPKVAEAGGMRTVKWIMRNVAPRPRSLAVSVPAGNVRAVMASTYESQDAVMDVVRSWMYSPEDGAVQALLEKISSSRDRRSIVDKIHGYISSGLGQCPLTPAQTGYKVRPVREVIGSAYATDAEKTSLACALLRAAGVESGLLLAFPKTSEDIPAGLAAMQNIMASGFVDPADEATADIAAYLEIMDIDGKPAAAAAPDHKVDVRSTLKVSASEGRQLAEGIYTFQLPDAVSGWLSAVYPHTAVNTDRPVNLLLPYLADETYSCVVESDAGMKAVILPEPVQISNSVGTVSVDVSVEEGRTVITRSLRLTRQLIVPSDYPQYYELMSEWYTLCVSPLVFRAE